MDVMTVRDVAPRRNRGEVEERSEAGYPFASLRREMDRLFDDFFRGAPRVGWLPGTAEGALTPSVDVAETDREVTVTAELPGLDEKDIEVSIRDNSLSIKGADSTRQCIEI
jgi:HSP20 family protein